MLASGLLLRFSCGGARQAGGEQCCLQRYILGLLVALMQVDARQFGTILHGWIELNTMMCVLSLLAGLGACGWRSAPSARLGYCLELFLLLTVL